MEKNKVWSKVALHFRTLDMSFYDVESTDFKDEDEEEATPKLLLP